MEALPSFTGYLIFAAPVFQALLATWKHDDLTSALLVCVVRGSHLVLLSVIANWHIADYEINTLYLVLMVLAGIKVIEFAGLAPGSFAGLILADNGADVIRVDKPVTSSNDILSRRKRSITINLKTEDGLKLIKKLVSTADIVIDPFRPGVLERLGLGPDVFLGNKEKKGLNEHLIYARIAGFPRTGPYKNMAGHDINYIALSGILSMLPGTDEKPAFPTNLLADFAGGGLMCVLGILFALIERGKSGRGQVVDVDMVSGTRYLSSFPLLLRHSLYSKPRGQNTLDGGAPFYSIYTCKDNGFMSLGCLEPQFFQAFINGFLKALPYGFALSDGWQPTIRSQHDRDEWSRLREFIELGFRTNSRQYWTEVFHGTDACAVPVLSPEEVSKYEVSKSSYPEPHPTIIGLSRDHVSANTDFIRLRAYRATTPSVADPYLQPGLHTKEILSELGLTEDEIRELELGTFRDAPSAKL